MAAGSLEATPTLSVTFIIPARNEALHLTKCLASIDGQFVTTALAPIETIVVDNQSTDRTGEIAAQAADRVINVEPGRASRARNAGARVATGDWLAFVDADCELPANWLDSCGRRLAQPDVIAVGSPLQAPGAGATWVESAWYAICHSLTPREPTPVRWLPAFNMLVRRQDFEAVGGFDEGLETCEDCELGYRLATRGQLLVIPEVAALHHGESRTLRQLFRREAWRSRGNLRLAAMRPRDLRNWISFLLPVMFVAGLAGAVATATLSSRESARDWLPTAMFLGLAALPFARILPRILRTAPTKVLPSAIVYAVFLAARTVGLVFPARRVERRS